MESQPVLMFYTSYSFISQGFLEKVGPGLPVVGAALQSPPRKRRFVVLTNTALKWYKKKDGDELFGDLVRPLTLPFNIYL